jgi:hypothetical protein
MKATTVFALAAITLMGAASMKAQTVISNETLVTTTLVVNKKIATAKCSGKNCVARAPMLKSIPVTCPAAIGKTCTFHVALDTKVVLSFEYNVGGHGGCWNMSGLSGYQFLVDGAPPTVGPIDADGNYVFAENVFTCSENAGGPSFLTRQSFPASVIATVTNTTSNSHTIDVNLVCSNTSASDGSLTGCEAVAHNSTMRVDVFEP